MSESIPRAPLLAPLPARHRGPTSSPPTPPAATCCTNGRSGGTTSTRWQWAPPAARCSSPRQVRVLYSLTLC